ncbi:MAG: hypothetical protein IPM54_43130 [Polyangiaceae bacterium]|nr:hypothetical protein [Polyangiaceae bacterium]
MTIPVELPLPIYSVLVAAYAAWGLWIGGSTILLVSTLFRNTAVVLGAIAAWVLASLGAYWHINSPYLRFFCIGYLMSPQKHFDNASMSLGTFFIMSTTMFVLIALIGSWRMRREEI